MFMFLSHPLDPEGYAWPGEPVVKTTQCTDVSDDCPFCSFVSELPNHCGTHMDAPRHFVKDGLSINDLSIDYFCHTEVALLEIPKGPAEGIYNKKGTLISGDVLENGDKVKIYGDGIMLETLPGHYPNVTKMQKIGRADLEETQEYQDKVNELLDRPVAE